VVHITPRRAVWLVGGAYLLAQVVLFSAHRAPSWDEAVYLSQVSPHSPAVVFAPSRARGIVLLVAPVASFTDSIAAVRIFLEIASAAALSGVFLLWVSVIGWAAPVAALLFGFSWLGLLYGSEVMPNLWVALIAVAAVALWVRSFEGKPMRETILAAVSLALVALFRPLDAVVLAVVLAGWAVAHRVDVARRLAAVAVGLVVGVMPWLVEMSVRFGGPASALRQAASTGHVNGSSIGGNALQYLYLSDGPTIGPDRAAHVSLLGALWWAGLVVLVVLGLLRSRGSVRRGAGLATVGGVAFLLEYLIFVSGFAPRFLLPALALLGIAAAVGLTSLMRGERGRVVLAAALGLMLVWAGFQIGTARRIEHQTSVDRARVRLVGLELRELASGRPCTFTSSDGFAQMQLASGCMGHPLRAVPGPGPRTTIEFLVLSRSVRVPEGWRMVRETVGSGGRPLTIYEAGP
jgi:hypothetical protein